jgi:hypothetical protein
MTGCSAAWHPGRTTGRCAARRPRPGATLFAVRPVDREVVQHHGRRSGSSRWWRRIRAPCWPPRALAGRQGGDAGAEELDELAGDAHFAQPLGDGQCQVGGQDARLQRPVSRTPITSGMRKHGRHAEHDGLRFQAAHAPAQHADAVDHRGVAVGADHRVGHGPRAPSRCSVTTVASCSRLMVCMMPVPGGWMRTSFMAFDAQRRNW